MQGAYPQVNISLEIGTLITAYKINAIERCRIPGAESHILQRAKRSGMQMPDKGCSDKTAER